MANRRQPSREAYRRAQLAARRAEGAVEAAAIRKINAELRKFARDLSSGVALLPGGERGVAESRRLLNRLAGRLERNIMGITENARRVSFEQINTHWTKAAEEVAALQGITGASLGAVVNPPISLLGAYEAVGAGNWRTLVRGYTQQTIDRAEATIRRALLRFESPATLARRLRPFIEGTGKSLVFNTKRIAISEIHNARSEAEVQHFINDPYVRAVAWRLAPDRGTLEGGDECDVLATNDFYGLGPGIYPVDAVPLTPHPHDRCERVPVVQDEPLAKPRNMKRILDPRDVKYPRGLSPQRRRNLERRMERLMTLSDEQPRLQEAFRAFEQFPQEKYPTTHEFEEETGQKLSKAELKKKTQELQDKLWQEYKIDISTVHSGIGGKVTPKVEYELYRGLLASLDDLERAGISRHKISRLTVWVEREGTDRAVAHVRIRARTMRLNADRMKSAKQMGGQNRAQARERWWASGHERQTYHHEFGHLINGDKNTHRVPRSIARKVSKYATTNDDEFMAETFAGLLDGKQYSDDVMQWYKKLRGVIPEGEFVLERRAIAEAAAASKKAKRAARRVVPPAEPPPPPTPGPVIADTGAVDWAAKVPKGRPARDVIRAGVKSGRTNEEIIAEVKRRNPTSRVSAATVRKVRRELKRAGVTPEPGPPAPSAATATERALDELEKIILREAHEEAKEIPLKAFMKASRVPEGVSIFPNEALALDIVEVPVAKLRSDSLQKTVRVGRLREVIKGEGLPEPDGTKAVPLIVRTPGGRLVIYDGHHRVVAALLRGERTIKVRIYQS